MEMTKEEKQDNLKECVKILEKVIILLEDNPKIKDIEGFYNAESLVTDVDWVRQFLKDTFKIKVN